MIGWPVGLAPMNRRRKPGRPSMSSRPGILVADPDRGIQRLLQRIFCAAGYTVTTANTAASTIARIIHTEPDLILLSAEFEDMGGSQLVTRARAATSAPIIALFYPNGASSPQDLLDRGADDCVEKPFLVEELAARARRLLLRAGIWLHPHAVPTAAGLITIDPLSRTAQLGERQLNLTSREFDLLMILLNAGGMLVPHNEVARRIWGKRHTNAQHNLRRVVGTLRARIECDPRRPRLLTNVRGLGYRLEISAAPDADICDRS
jgi:two-component system KDP operon response regulator KdpE